MVIYFGSVLAYQGVIAFLKIRASFVRSILQGFGGYLRKILRRVGLSVCEWRAATVGQSHIFILILFLCPSDALLFPPVGARVAAILLGEFGAFFCVEE